MRAEERWNYSQNVEVRAYQQSRTKEEYEYLIRRQLHEINPSNFM